MVRVAEVVITFEFSQPCVTSSSRRLGLLPPPLWGRDGEGGWRSEHSVAPRCEGIARPPPPTPPHKGEGSTPSVPRVIRPEFMRRPPVAYWLARAARGTRPRG